MKVEIYHLHKNLEVYTNVKLITVPTPHGMRGFLPDHMSFMGDLSKGILDIKVTPRAIKILVEKGYVQFENNVCKVFLT